MIIEYYVGKSVKSGEIVKGQLAFRFGDGAPIIIKGMPIIIEPEYVEVDRDSLDFVTEVVG